MSNQIQQEINSFSAIDPELGLKSLFVELCHHNVDNRNTLDKLNDGLKITYDTEIDHLLTRMNRIEKDIKQIKKLLKIKKQQLKDERVN
jgi:hypothetical protein